MKAKITGGRWYVYTGSQIINKKGTALCKVLDPKRDEVHWVFSTATEGGDKLADVHAMSKAKEMLELICKTADVFAGLTVQDLSPEAYKKLASLSNEMAEICQHFKD